VSKKNKPAKKKTAAKKPKKAKVWKWEKYIFAAARKTWRWSPVRREVIKEAKFGEFYRCNVCRKYVDEIQVDHINPIVPPETGFTTWDSYFNNLYCDKSNLQAICIPCHRFKTTFEQSKRKKKPKLTASKK
jgi:5-methylcytosine-specific restriction endonuclease McrA